MVGQVVLRVVFITRAIPEHGGGGLETSVWGLVQALVARGIEVTVVTTPSPAVRKPQTDIAGVTVMRAAGKPGRYSAAWARSAAAAAVQVEPDCIVSVSAAGRYAARGNVTPVILQAHGTSVDELLTALKTWRLSTPVRVLQRLVLLLRDIWDYSRYDAIIAVSPRIARQIRFIVPSRPIRYIPNGVVEIIGLSSVLDIEDSQESQLNLLFVGRLHREKGLDRILRSMQRDTSLVLAVLGDGPARLQLQALVRKLGLTSRVTFHGHVASEVIIDHMRRANLLVVPSRRIEGQPMVVLEAALIGLPAIVTKQIAKILDPSVPGVSFFKRPTRISAAELHEAAAIRATLPMAFCTGQVAISYEQEIREFLTARTRE